MLSGFILLAASDSTEEGIISELVLACNCQSLSKPSSTEPMVFWWMTVHRKILAHAEPSLLLHPFFGLMHIHEVLGWGLGCVSEVGEAVMLLLLLLLLLLLVTVVPMHVVPWVRACSEGPSELLSSSSRKFVKSLLEAVDAVVVLEAGRARSQPEQQDCASGGSLGALGSTEGSASAHHSPGTGFLHRLSILLFSGLILICMLQGWHVCI